MITPAHLFVDLPPQRLAPEDSMLLSAMHDGEHVVAVSVQQLLQGQLHGVGACAREACTNHHKAVGGHLFGLGHIELV